MLMRPYSGVSMLRRETERESERECVCVGGEECVERATGEMRWQDHDAGAGEIEIGGRLKITQKSIQGVKKGIVSLSFQVYTPGLYPPGHHVVGGFAGHVADGERLLAAQVLHLHLGG